MMHSSRLFERIIYYSFVALFFLTPLIFYPFTKYFPIPFVLFGFDPFTYELFEFNKMYFVYLIATLVGSAWLLRCLFEGKVIFKRTFVDYALILFLLSQFLSTLFSIDIHTSLWGYYSRFHGGFLSTLSYLILYWGFVSNVYEQHKVRRFLIVSLFSGTLVALYGVAQHFGVDAEYWVQNVQARVFSSLGQPNWLAAYLVALFPLSLSFFLLAYRLRDKILYGLSTLLIYTALVYTGSRSGLLALVITLLFYSALVYAKRVQHSGQHPSLVRFIFPLLLSCIVSGLYIFSYYNFVSSALTVSLVMIFLSFLLLLYVYSHTSRLWIGILCIVILSIGLSNFTPDAFRLNTPATGASQSVFPQEAGGTETGRIRFIVWKGAWDIFTHYPILGSGVESFAYAFYQYRPLELLSTTEWDFLYNKAHNEYLNFLATSGIFGLVAYLLYIIHVYSFGIFKLFHVPHFSATQEPHLLLRVQSKKSPVKEPSQFSDSFTYLIITALLCGFSGILITNFFGFSVVVVGLQFFLYSAFIGGILAHERSSLIFSYFRSKFSQISVRSFIRMPFQREVGIIACLCMSVFIVVHILFFWVADIAFAKGRSYNRQGQISAAYTSFLDAISLRQDEPFYYSELGWTQANMVYALMEENDASTSAELAQFADRNAQTAVAMSPRNVTYWKKLTDTYYNLTFYDFETYAPLMIRSADRTQTLAPTDANTLLTLSLYYERGNKHDVAYSIVERVTKWKPDLASAWYRLGELSMHFYDQTQDARYKIQAETFQKKALELEPSNPDYQKPF